MGWKSAIVWLGVLVVFGYLGWVQVTENWHLQTDILALLPEDEQDLAMQSLRRIVSGTLGRTVLVLIGHENVAVAQAATRKLGTWMAENSLFERESVLWDYGQHQQAFFDLYFPLRYHILSPDVRQQLQSANGYDVLLQQLQQNLYQPTSSFITPFLAMDPLLFFPALAQVWGQRTGSLRIQNGLLTRQHNGRSYHVITAQIGFNPFDAPGQRQFVQQWHDWVVTLQQLWPNLEVRQTSAAQFAAASRESIQRDMVVIGIGSMLGVIVLILSTFRSLRYLLLALIPIVTGLGAALSLCLWLFGELHALTLAFGASLIGICIDYSFHYFAHHRVAPVWDARTVMRQLCPALSLGMFTTVVSYIGLAFTPLVGLQQIAVFAACGILVSFATVVLWFPFGLPHLHLYSGQHPLLYRGARSVLVVWQRFRNLIVAISILAVILCLPGLWRLNVNDSPRLLNDLPPDLVSQDQLIRQRIGLPSSESYLIVRSESAETALRTLESAYAEIQATQAGIKIPWVVFGPVLTTFLPSIEQQQRDLVATQTLLQHGPALTDALTQFGLEADMIQGWLSAIENPTTEFLEPDVWREHPASAGLRHLWLGEADLGAAILVPLLRVTDPSALQAVLDRFDGLHYVNAVEELTRVLRRYRRQATWLAIGAYGLIFSILLWRYGKNGFSLILPPLLAALLTLSVLGFLGQPFHLVHVLALLLILGMGVDYTIFIAESPPNDCPTTLLALTLSALTTVFSFGLLSLSQQAVLQAIGLTTLIGIALTLVLAPMAYYCRDGPKKSDHVG